MCVTQLRSISARQVRTQCYARVRSRRSRALPAFYKCSRSSTVAVHCRKPGRGRLCFVGAGSRRKSFGKLAALLIFAILAGLGAVCLTSHSRFGPALSHWRDSHSATHADPSAQHPIFLKLSIPTWLMHGPSVQHVQMLQHYTPWLTQPLVAADVAVESERDSQLAQDSWQQHVIPAIFKQHSTDSTILAQTDAASGIWQRLSARLPAPVLQICSQAISWLSRLRMQQPGSADFQSQLAELEEQPPDQSESDSADQVALRPELMWQHLRSVLQRVTDGLKGHLAARADSQLTPGPPLRCFIPFAHTTSPTYIQ